ncbi:hypothetical protein PENSPDRAFT_602400 [Peniophora sp. CONT]|nr:hypothetical protein PENSPDRAFT_602400 [Peniophora sp. CONT]
MDPSFRHSSSNNGRPLWLVLVAGVGVLYMAYSLLFAPAPGATGPTVTKAVAVLSGDVSGTVTFSQASPDAPVYITGDLKNLDADAERGFHIHALGDLSNGCVSAGSHFNPFDKTHGAPTDENRHVGDLGNIESDGKGLVSLSIKDEQLTLNGPLSIIGRAVVVHAGTDDLGKGGNDESLKTGNAGGRAACGVIGIA